MSPAPTRETPAGRAYNDLRNLARREGRDSAELFTLYVLEGFLARLASSEQADEFVLKGGVLMATFAARRPTRDIDLAALGVSNDTTELEQRVRAIIRDDLDDGIAFDQASVSGEPIRDDADYPGVRIKLTARLGTARIPLHVDVNFGDPIWPAPTDAILPRILGGTLRLRGYPDHMVLAEKIVTAVDRGESNTRWRDFVDINAITRVRSICYEDQRTAINTVAVHRQVDLVPLESLLTAMPTLAQRKWATWRGKQRLDATTPERLEDVLSECVAFADPVLDASAAAQVWNPVARSWTSRNLP